MCSDQVSWLWLWTGLDFVLSVCLCCLSCTSGQQIFQPLKETTVDFCVVSAKIQDRCSNMCNDYWCLASDQRGSLGVKPVLCVCWFDLFITLTLMWFLSVKPETSMPPKQLKKGWYATLQQPLCSSSSTAPSSVASWHPPVLPFYPAPSWWSKPNLMLFFHMFSSTSSGCMAPPLCFLCS